MKSFYMLLSAVLFTAFSTYAQNLIQSTGNVGIGTITPAFPLDVYTSTNGTTAFQFTNNNTGSLARTRFVINNGVNYAIINLNSTTYPTDPNSLSISAPFSGGGAMMFNTGGQERLRLDASGNIGIGTTTPDAKLAVKGTIHSQAVLIDMNGWNDYVFKKGYRLIPLSEVKIYIDQNQHLPEIPSAQEMVKNGLDVGEMNKLLMKKVEELTLYVIEAKEEINELKKQVKNLKKQIK
jgi:hypothetical protein